MLDAAHLGSVIGGNARTWLRERYYDLQEGFVLLGVSYTYDRHPAMERTFAEFDRLRKLHGRPPSNYTE